MFVYLVNVKEGVHRDWECGAPASFIAYFLFFYIFGLYATDRHAKRHCSSFEIFWACLALSSSSSLLSFILHPTQLCGKIPEGVSRQSRSYPTNTGSPIIQPPRFTVYTDKLYSSPFSYCYGLLQMAFCGQINKSSFSYWLLVREQVYICI